MKHRHLAKRLHTLLLRSAYAHPVRVAWTLSKMHQTYGNAAVSSDTSLGSLEMGLWKQRAFCRWCRWSCGHHGPIACGERKPQVIPNLMRSCKTHCWMCCSSCVRTNQLNKRQSSGRCNKSFPAWHNNSLPCSKNAWRPSPLTRTRQILRSLLPRTARPKANGIPTLATSHGMSLPTRPFQQLDKGPVRRYLQLPLEKSLEWLARNGLLMWNSATLLRFPRPPKEVQIVPTPVPPKQKPRMKWLNPNGYGMYMAVLELSQPFSPWKTAPTRWRCRAPRAGRLKQGCLDQAAGCNRRVLDPYHWQMHTQGRCTHRIPPVPSPRASRQTKTYCRWTCPVVSKNVTLSNLTGGKRREQEIDKRNMIVGFLGIPRKLATEVTQFSGAQGIFTNILDCQPCHKNIYWFRK